jgi:hypothetical protein
MGDFKPCKGESDYFEIPVVTWGDYAGDTVARSNYEFFMETYGENPLVYDIIGGYNLHSIVCHVDILKDEQISELLEGLENYPLMNEESHSELESTLESESWDGWIKSDLKRVLDESEIDYPEDDSELESLFWHCIRYNDIDFTHESAVSPYLDLKKVVVDGWGKGFCPSCSGMLYYHGDECQNCPNLPNMPKIQYSPRKFINNIWRKWINR